jgi:tellurite resistance protein TerA
MMTIMVVKGQKVDVTKQFPGLSKVIVGLGWRAQSGLELDASAFQLGASGKVKREEDFIFYGNPRSVNGSVAMCDGSGDAQQFELELSAIPADVEKIAFTITIYDAISRGQTFRQVSDMYLRILHPVTKVEIIRFPLNNFSIENSIVSGELYRYKGEWKFNAISSGFHGGLAALCGNFGVEVAQPETSGVPPAPTSSQAPPPPPPAPPPAPPINLTKVELTKRGETISLRKSSGALGQISVNLNWNRQTKKSIGFFGFDKPGGMDLDLGCLFEMSDGYKGCIQALGGNFGDYEYFPYVELDGDDRTGARSDGENLRINGNHVREFDRILLYAYIYEGAAKWAETDGVVTIRQAENPDITVRMDVHDPRKIMCAVAMIERIDDTFQIRRLVEYFNGHKQMDRFYGWNMDWSAGSK